MRLGINFMAWSGAVGQAELDLLPGIAALGYDGVELPIFTPEAIDTAAVRRALAAGGLACTVSTALPRGASLLEPAQRDAGVDYLGHCAAAAAACGATLLCGPLYAPVGLLPGRPRTQAEWDSCVAGLRAAGDRAAEHGVTLAVELLNRFETHFLNTVEDGLALLDSVDHPAVGLHLDTFHLNIEEKGPAEAFRRGMRRLRHVHVAENDRGSVGSGHVDWPGIRDALRAGGYDGWLVAETFTATIPEIAAATAIWRPLVPDGWTYARDSIAFLRRLLGA
ncbi:MAG: sugar phosphate isomerase/epimerase family protein [Chloroflexota bacterium]